MNQHKQHQVAVFCRHFVPLDVNHLFEHMSFQESVTLFMDRLWQTTKPAQYGNDALNSRGYS